MSSRSSVCSNQDEIITLNFKSLLKKQQPQLMMPFTPGLLPSPGPWPDELQIPATQRLEHTKLEAGGWTG